MRILIGEGNYPKLSESYVEIQIGYLLRQGIELAVYSKVCGSPEAEEIVPVFRGDLDEALKQFKPDVFHADFITYDHALFEQVSRKNIPITIRGHSFDFDIGRARRLADQAFIRKIWLFPHFARAVAHPKVDPLTVAYDSALYKPFPDKDRKLVYRTAAGKAGKGLEDFFLVATRCPAFRFSLSANLSLGEETYLDDLRSLASSASVEFSANLLRSQTVERMNRAGIYLLTSDPKSHPFGMPISLAEAMATGCYVLARENASIREYLGDAGAVYKTVDEAAELIKQTEAWSPSEWEEASGRSIRRAQAFTEETVLKALPEFWRTGLGL